MNEQEQQTYRLLDFLDGGRGVALGKVADQEGLDSNIDSTFRQKVFLDLDFDSSADYIPSDGLVGDVNLELIVDSGANINTDAVLGEDKTLFNIIRHCGWYNDVIEEG